MELFRQFAAVKSIHVIRDLNPASRTAAMHTTGAKGFAYIEFYSTEHATYALSCYNNSAAELRSESSLMNMKVSYARETVMHQVIQV